ncbi:MAG: hypothetical protein CMI12_09765 [Oceanospirillum sp.]|nr:hypothetical protein [Oceanospirillum sp.]
MNRIPIRTRYLLLFSAGALMLMLLFSAAIYGELQRLNQSISDVSQKKVHDSLVNEVISRSEVLLESLASSLSTPAKYQHLSAIDEQLKLVSATPLVRQALVYDDNYEVLHDGTPGLDSFGNSVDPLLPVRISLSQAGFRVLNNQLLMNQPILHQGEQVGGVLLWLSLVPVKRSVYETEQAINTVLESAEQQFMLFLIYMVVAFGLLALILSALLSNTVTRPVQALMDYSQSLALGRWELPDILKKGDEFGRLGLSFKNMAAQIQNNVRNIETLAFNDQLTGIGNRTFFQQQISDYVTDEPDGKITLLQIDLDNFKWFNETRGFHAGDLLLKKMVAHCSKVLDEWCEQWVVKREDVHLARLGGDEFGIILLGDISRHGVHGLTENLMTVFNPAQDKAHPLHGMQASIGVAIYPLNTCNISEIQHHVSLALNEAKVRGKNRVVYFEDEMNARLQRRYELEQALLKARRQGELFMVYQPQVNISTGNVVGYEALMRWQNDKLGFVSPAEFFPIAEESPVVQELGEFVIEQVLQDIPLLCESHGHKVKVSLNVSAAQFFYHDVADLLIKGMKAHNVDPAALSVELTETALLEKDQIVLEQLSRLRSAGVAIMLDDFGTGYASLSYLKEFPITGLKVDRSYTARLCSGDPSDFALFESLLFLANNLGLSTVVEGIENEHEEQQAQLAGAKVAQGFKYAKGLPIEEQLLAIEMQISA